MEAHNVDKGVIDQLYKKASISLCSNVSGQVAVGLMVNQPKSGDAAFDTHQRECKEIYGMRSVAVGLLV